MQFQATNIPDILLITPQVYGDERGFFMETYQARQFMDAGVLYPFVQDNHSGSQRGTLRGLHYQIQHSQGKLLRVVAGEIFDVAVDLRRSSPTFGQWVATTLSAQNKMQIWIPPGFAHGFYVMSDWAELVYKATDYYLPQWERCLIWNDPRINIHWPIIDGQPLIISTKDAQGKSFDTAEIYD
jgi:dTDP-4-dehydrorhamnose 3,5-epimerase